MSVDMVRNLGGGDAEGVEEVWSWEGPCPSPAG
jgi:hypothetical protein